MKRSLLFLLSIFLIAGTANTQGLLKKVSKSMTDELLGKSGNSSDKKSNQPEPASACDNSELIMDMGGKLQLDYTELNISISDDGKILAKDRHADSYYIVQNGITTGPLKPGDKRLKGFENVMENNSYSDTDSDTEKDLWKGNPYITRSEEKFLITFGGITYGPYAQINSFIITQSKKKFAAIVIETIVVTEDQGESMDEAMKNAKTDQERMELAMKYASEIQQKVIQGGGASAMLAKFVTNIPDTNFDPNLGGTLSGVMKYDDILVNLQDKVLDLNGKTIITIRPEYGGSDIFVSTDDSRYAMYNYGTLTFNDNTSIPELFNPHLMNVDGKINLGYMYYSPKKNSILQCRLPF